MIKELNFKKRSNKVPHSGCIVKTKTGKIGRTYSSNELVNGKAMVYLADKAQTNIEGINLPISYNGGRLLCDPKSLQILGYID